MSIDYHAVMHDLDAAIRALSELINDQDMTILERDSCTHARAQLCTLSDHLFQKIGRLTPKGGN